MTKQISETLNQGLQFKNKQNAIKENAPKKFKEGFQMSSNTNNKYVPTSYSDPINALDKLEIGNTQDILSTASNAQGQIADIKTLQTQFNTLYNQYITAQNLLLTDTRTNVTNNNNKGSNANLGKNIRTQAGAIGYVTNQGVYKWYDSMDILEDTAGFNQCPGQTWTQLPTNTIPANLTLGSAMVSGQSCGNEGKNVFVSSVIKDPSSTYLGNFNDNSASRAMNLLSQGQVYTYETCQKAAADYGYTYFAVQDGNAGTSQCFVSNNLTQAEEYGTANSSVAVASATIGGKQYGTSGVNAVYQLTQTGQNTESVGQMGYVDENSNLSVYPTSMLGQGTEYVTLANSNLPGGANIAGDPVTTITSESQCKSACNSTDSCNGYVWGGSGSCWLQSGKNLQQNIATGNIGLANGAITSFQIPSILNSSSCTKDVVKIDSIQWDNYVQNSQDMTPDTTCGLATQIAPELASVDALEGQLNAVSAKIIAQTSALLKLNSDGSKQIKINDLTLNENLQKYTELNAQFDNTKNKNISGIVSDSNIQIIQNNYSYILWSILAIIAIIITIKLMKK